MYMYIQNVSCVILKLDIHFYFEYILESILRYPHIHISKAHIGCNLRIDYCGFGPFSSTLTNLLIFISLL